MYPLFALLLTALHVGASRAAELQDAPIPEPNYLGIAIFLAICIGCCWWFYRAVMRSSEQAKQIEPRP